MRKNGYMVMTMVMLIWCSQEKYSGEQPKQCLVHVLSLALLNYEPLSRDRALGQCSGEN